MDFTLNDDQHAFIDMAAQFARDELAPYAAQWDSESHFPVAVLKKAAALGLAGIYAKEDIGGSELSRLDAALIFEQLSQHCISTSAYLSIHNMVTGIIDSYGSATLRQHYGPGLTSMDRLASYCLTEPNAGSDAASLKTTAVKNGDHYVINGAKAFISGGSVSDVYLCMVRTGDDTHRGISCVMIDKDTPGLSFGKQEKKLGWHSQPTCMVFFENCRVPVQNLVGEEGQGFKIALNALNGGRVNIAACSLGGAKACLLAAKQYMGERKQFSKSLNQFQGLRFKFATMLSQYEAAKWLVYRAALSLDNQLEDAPLHCAMAKQLATDNAFTIADETMQIHGGYGYLCEYPIERIFRDLRVHRILEGTNEIMGDIVAKHALKEHYQL